MSVYQFLLRDRPIVSYSKLKSSRQGDQLLCFVSPFVITYSRTGWLIYQLEVAKGPILSYDKNRLTSTQSSAFSQLLTKCKRRFIVAVRVRYKTGSSFAVALTDSL